MLDLVLRLVQGWHANGGLTGVAMKIAKQQRRQLRRGYRRLREAAADVSPPWLRRIGGPVVDTLDMLFIDHGIFRMLYANRYELAPGVWRASQPAPYQVRAYARQGIRTIVNLRGERECGAYRLEQAACQRAGITLIDFPVKSRAAPDPPRIREAADLFRRIEYPVLLHCKSGADRAGLMSTLYLILKEGRPVSEALSQLHWRYGHFRSADTGILDRFFESYLAHDRQTPMPFLDWVERVYDPVALKRDFRSDGALSWLLRLTGRE